MPPGVGCPLYLIAPHDDTHLIPIAPHPGSEGDATGAELYRPCVHEERAALAHALGDTEGWRRELATAERLFTAMGADAHAARLTAGLDP